jgi:hypothetical protein
LEKPFEGQVLLAAIKTLIKKSGWWERQIESPSHDESGLIRIHLRICRRGKNAAPIFTSFPSVAIAFDRSITMDIPRVFRVTIADVVMR